MTGFHARTLMSCLGLSVSLFASPAGAQTASDEGDGPFIEEMIVTSQKREQSLQDVPISVTAISGDDLSFRQVTDFQQLQFVVPGVTFQPSINARASATVIRGIGTQAFSDGIEGSVALAVDGVIIGREGGGLSDFNDVERIEVLRGPQGTLFGKNASAGVISIVTKGPTEEFSADFGISYASFDEFKVNGAFSGPIIEDRLLFRVSSYFNTRDGFVENVLDGAPDDDLNDRNEFGFRAKLEFLPTDTVSILITGDYQNREADSFALTTLSTSAGGVLPNGALAGLLGFGVPVIGPTLAANGVTPGPDNLQIAAEGDYFQDQEIWGVSLQADVSFGEYEFTSISAYRNWSLVDNNDPDVTPLPLLAVNSAFFEQEQFSQEFRIASPVGRRIEYVAGLYFFHQEVERPSTTQLGTAGLDLLGVLPAGVFLGTDATTDFDEFNIAGFGQVDFHLNDRLTLTGGVRVLYSDVEGFVDIQQSTGVFPGITDETFTVVGLFPGQVATPVPLTGQDGDVAVTYRAALFYDLAESTSVFASVSRGYKAAGFVLDLSTEAATPGGTDLALVEPEIPFQIEAGWRSSWFGGRLTFNTTGYYTEVTDFQAEAALVNESGFVEFETLNAGTAEIFGVEAEVVAAPIDGLSLTANMAFTRAEFTEFDTGPCFVGQAVGPSDCVDADGDGVGDFQDLAGSELPDAPDLTINFSARYDVIDTPGPLIPFLGFGLHYRTGTNAALDADPNAFIDDYVTVDFQAGFSSRDGRYTLYAFGRNLNDADFVNDIVDHPFDTGGFAQFPEFQSQRIFGVQFRASY